MRLSTISVKRPVFAGVLSVVLVVLGLASLGRLEVRQYPDVDPPVVSVDTNYRGASADVVDAEITKRLIDRLSGIEGVRTIESRSSDGNSSIDVEFVLSRDLDLAAADVRDAIASVREDLPDDVVDPEVRKSSSDSSPIIWISLTSDTLNALELTDYADRTLAERISLLDGVSRVRIGGERRYAIRVWLDRQAMAARGVTVDDIASRLEAENVELPAGRIESKLREFSVRAMSRLTEPGQFEQLVIRGEGVQRVRLGDVARVEMAAQDDRTGFTVNGKTSISLGIVRQSNANTVEVADAVRAEISRIEPTLPEGVNIRIASDDSVFIRESIREVATTLLIAIGLVVLVILVFIGSLRATLVPAVAIPVSVLGAMVVLYALGFSINVLTLLAAVLAIGLVVDDAIVVLENIERRIRGGEKPLVAAANGAREVGFAVIATTVVLVAVFIPLSFLTGKVGRLFTEFGITMAAAVMFSSFVALTVAVSLCAQILRARESRDGAARRPGPLARLSGWVARGVLGVYGALIDLTIRLRWFVAIVAVGIGASAYWFFVNLPSELTPTEDQGVFYISVEAPQGSSLEYTAAQVRKVEALLEPYWGPGGVGDNSEGGPLDRVITILSPGWGGASGVNQARIIARTLPWEQRSISTIQIVNEISPKLAAIPGVRAFASLPAGLGIRGGGQPIQFAVGGPDFETARAWADTVVSEVEGEPMFRDLRADFEATTPQLAVKIDRERAIDVGVDVAAIGRALQTFLGGREVTEFFDRGELYEVILQADPADRASPGDLSDIYVRSGTNGQLIPLSSVVTTDERGTVRELRRVNRVPSVLIAGSVNQGYSLGQALERLERAVEERLPPGATVNYLGESLEYKDSSLQLYITFGMALILVYLALAAQFESVIHPITIMVSVPLAVTGGLGALWLTGATLNIYSQIGLILLIGLMAKNGILMVEFANQLARQGKSAREAVKEAAKVRLRPILMTAISTILGAVPLVLASGAGAEGRRAIGDVIVGGMGFATLLTLFVIPALYVILSPLTKSGDPVEARFERQMAEHDAKHGGANGPVKGANGVRERGALVGGLPNGSRWKG